MLSVESRVASEGGRFVPVPAASPCCGLHGPAAALWPVCQCSYQMFVFCGAGQSPVFLVKSFIISNVGAPV